MPLSSARQNKESEKSLFFFLIQINKKQIRTMYVNQIPNQGDDMLTKTRN